MSATSLKLTILVATVPNRLHTFYPRIMTELMRQTADRTDVEVIALFDNKKRTIGKKRDDLLQMAQGRYVVFIDDDDRLHEDFVYEIVKAIDRLPVNDAGEGCDCIVYNSMCSVNGDTPYLCKYGMEYNYEILHDGTPQKEWHGKPAHTMVYRTALAQRHRFTDMGHGEDYDWVKRACTDIKSQYRIDKVLYYYDAAYNMTSETAGLSDAQIKENMAKLVAEKKF